MGRDQALASVMIERARQSDRWGDEHDDTHTDGSLADAAAWLATVDLDHGDLEELEGDDLEAELEELGWAVKLRFKHRDDRRQQLVIAAALLLAEIERLDRARL